jgi:hypothetical protein
LKGRAKLCSFAYIPANRNNTVGENGTSVLYKGLIIKSIGKNP